MSSENCLECDSEDNCSYQKCSGCKDHYCDGEYYEHGAYCSKCKAPMCGGCMEYGFPQKVCKECEIVVENCYCDSCLCEHALVAQ